MLSASAGRGETEREEPSEQERTSRLVSSGPETFQRKRIWSGGKAQTKKRETGENWIGELKLKSSLLFNGKRENRKKDNKTECVLTRCGGTSKRGE